MNDTADQEYTITLKFKGDKLKAVEKDGKPGKPGDPPVNGVLDINTVSIVKSNPSYCWIYFWGQWWYIC